jgi:transcriptional regulator with XRE-family HTH domain
VSADEATLAIIGAVDRLRFGRAVRALRQRRGLTQTQLGDRLGWSRSKVSRIERGRLAGVTYDDLERLAAELDAGLRLDLAWRGAGLDRLIDERHATLVDAVVRWLAGASWIVAVEASFSEFGERGSIDVFACHPSGALLVVEVKASIGDANQTLIGIDRKVRLAPAIAR